MLLFKASGVRNVILKRYQRKGKGQLIGSEFYFLIKPLSSERPAELLDLLCFLRSETFTGLIMTELT